MSARWGPVIRDAALAAVGGGVVGGVLAAMAVANLSKTDAWLSYAAFAAAAWWFVGRSRTSMWTGVPIALAASWVGGWAMQLALTLSNPDYAQAIRLILASLPSGGPLARLQGWGEVALAGLIGGFIAEHGQGGPWPLRRRPWKRWDLGE